MLAKDVLDFWFNKHGPSDWWKKSDTFDAKITDRFARAWEQGVAGEFWTWRETSEGRLAEIILLDQFPRNMFRNSGKAFASDALALALSQEAVSAGALAELADGQKPFLIMPYMHSESAIIHDEAVRLFNEPGLQNNLDFELRHKAIIDRFGRYPHRNEALGRESTAEEREFLKEPGSSF